MSAVSIRSESSGTARSERGPFSVDAIIRSHHEALLRFLRRRLATPDDALDAAQEAYLRLLRYEGVSGIDSPSAMLFKIAANVAADHARAAHARRSRRCVDIDEAQIESEQPSAERALCAAQRAAQVASTIESLAPKCREVFLLSRLGGLTYEEIAHRCRISVKTVEKHIGLALRACAREA